MVRLELERVRAAARLIDPVFLDTPQFEAPPLSAALGCSMVLKVETLNPVGSFKGRGTETVMSALLAAGYTSAVCASAGNLGLALAHSGARHGVPVTVFAAESANPLKIERMRAAGATVHLEGIDIERPRELARASRTDGAYWSRTASTWGPAKVPPPSASSSWPERRISTWCSSPWAAVHSRAASGT